jgi:hypothetical protein
MSQGSGLFGDEPGDGGDTPQGEAPGSADDGTFADVLNGFSLDSGRSRRKRKKSGKETKESPPPAPPAAVAGAHAAADSPAAPPPQTDQGDGVTSLVSPPGSTDADGPRPGGLFDPGPPSGEFSMPSAVVRHDRVDPVEETSIVRPYALTGGRTRANYALELETLISTKDHVAAGGFPQAAAEQIESISIMEACRTPRSVAEIAAVLSVPLGVARVLISDAADAGLVAVHRTITGQDGAEAHLMLMERVLSGLRRL